MRALCCQGSVAKIDQTGHVLMLPLALECEAFEELGL